MISCLLHANRLLPRTSRNATWHVVCNRSWELNSKYSDVTHARSYHSRPPMKFQFEYSSRNSSATCLSRLLLKLSLPNLHSSVARNLSAYQSSDLNCSDKDAPPSKQDNYHQIKKKMSEKYDISEDSETDGTNKVTSQSNLTKRVSPSASGIDEITSEPDNYYTSFDPETECVAKSLEDRQSLSAEGLMSKYDYVSKSRAKDADVVINAPYGSVRIDSLNKNVKDKTIPSSSLAPDKYIDLAKMQVPWHSDESEASKRQQRSRRRSRNVETHRLQSHNVVEEQFFPEDDYYVVDISAKTSRDMSPDVSHSSGYVPHETKSTIKEGESTQNFFDEQFFPMSESNSASSESMQPVLQPQKTIDIDKPHTEQNFYDEKFISQSDSDFPKLNSIEKTSEKFMNNDQSDNYFDEQLLLQYTANKSSLSDESVASEELTDPFSLSHKDNQDQHMSSVVSQNREKLFISAQSLASEEASNEFDAQYFHSQTNESSSLFNTAEEVDIATKQVKKANNTKEKKVEKQDETAFDVAMKIQKEEKDAKTEQKFAVAPAIIQKWEGKIDSHGYKILEDQVDRLKYLSTDDVVSLLRNNILYEDDNILAINKPYGLPSHGGPGVHHSVGGLLDPLARKINPRGAFTLYLSHRLDKETTGVMLLPKNQEYYVRVREMFKKREVIKKYWAITKGIPNPSEGIVDIPIGEGRVGSMVRMTLFPKHQEAKKFLIRGGSTAKKSRKEKFDAVTYFKVLDSNNSVALVECQPETGVKHQIRCHLAFGLNCPILGDHKYSHFSKIAPQKLFPEVLTRLGIRQSKVRHLAMHLHAKALILPNFKDGRNLFISAKLPHHFVQNMKWLKLSAPKK